MGAETTVVTATLRERSSPLPAARSASMSSSSSPTSLPERSTHSPPWGTAMPRRSQSGSVAKRRSAFVSSQSSRPSSSASRTSGLGYGQVGNAPSCTACSSTTRMSVTPILARAPETHSRPTPCSGVYTTHRPEQSTPVAWAAARSTNFSMTASSMVSARPLATASS